MKRLIEKTVFSGLVTACRLAGAPTRRSPPSVNATTEGVVRAPSAFSIDGGLAALEDGHARVGRAQIDADRLAHPYFSLVESKEI